MNAYYLYFFLIFLTKELELFYISGRYLTEPIAYHVLVKYLKVFFNISSHYQTVLKQNVNNMLYIQFLFWYE